MVATNFFIVLTSKCNLKCKHCYDIKNNLDMSPELLKLTTDYVIDKINTTNESEYCIDYVGGEIGLYNQDLILNSIQQIKEKCQNKQLRFIYQTNLMFNVTNKHLDILKQMDEIGTSYDFLIRYNNYNQQLRWYKNVSLVQKLNVPIRVTTTMTKQTVEELHPQALFDLMLAMDIHILEFNKCLPVIGGKIPHVVLPKNEDVREWMYNAFKIYEQIRKCTDFFIPNFECMRDSFNGNLNWEHSRTCSLDNETISPNGNISTCLLTQHKPFYNLITKQYLNTKEQIHNEELQRNDLCKACQYYQYCNGDCQLNPFDDTGCTTPYKIYDYLAMMNELKGE